MTECSNPNLFFVYKVKKKDCYTRIIYNYTYYLELSTYTDIYLPNTTYVSTLYTYTNEM